MMSRTDEIMLKSIGISDTPDDPHIGCRVRWLEEREAADRAIAARLKAEETYQGIIAARDKDVDKWKNRASWWATICAVMALAVFALWVSR